MKTVEVSYFYPTSMTARRFKMPAGGYHISITGEPDTAFTNKTDAFRYATESGHPFTAFSLTPELPQSCAALESIRNRG